MIPNGNRVRSRSGIDHLHVAVAVKVHDQVHDDVNVDDLGGEAG